jgi:hypothetical protein
MPSLSGVSVEPTLGKRGSAPRSPRLALPRLSSVRATPLGLCRLTLWSFLALLISTTLADADLWGHLRFGLDILEAKALHTSDPYSFTSDRLWINHEWLSELLMALAYRALGPAGLGLLKLSAIAVVFAVLWSVARDAQARPLARDLFVGLALFVTYSRTQVVRPQLFSVALFFFLLHLLRQVDKGHIRALFFVPPCFALWANFHGAWIVGLAALGTWILGDTWMKRDYRRASLLAVVGALSVVATLANPYGVGLWQFVAETVRPARPDISDWKPLWQLPPGILFIESLLPAAAIAAFWRMRTTVPWQPAPRDLAVVLLLAVATFRVGRVDAFFQAALAVAMAPALLAWFAGVEDGARASLRRASLAVGLFAIALAIYVVVHVIDNVRVVRVEGRWVPDRTAALLLRDARPGARVLTWFDWGEYALWQLSPAGIRVSMDGRRETVYSERMTSEHMRFYAGDPAMIDLPERIGADHIWLPSRLTIIEPLERRGWTKVLDTGKSVVLSRNATPIPVRPIPDGPNVFPWP